MISSKNNKNYYIIYFIVLIVFICILILVILHKNNSSSNKPDTSISITFPDLGPIKNLCPSFLNIKPTVPTDIQKIEDLSQLSEVNLSGFLLTNYLVSAWSGKCINAPPDVDNFKLVNSYKGYDTSGKTYRNIACFYYSESLKMAIMSFTGTMYYSELGDDFDFTQGIPTVITTDPSIMVENKHYKIYESLYLQFQNDIKNLPSETTLIVTGHSLGGSLSGICYLDLILNLSKITNNKIYKALYTFGAPRVGNVNFANIINTDPNTFRITNTEDIIPYLPFPLFKDKLYEHFDGKEIAFSMNLGSYGKNHIDAYTMKFLTPPV